jgi:hypothetical protein
MDHVYASAGASTVDCAAPLELSEPLSGVSLDQCKEACDAAFPACVALDYAGRSRLCTLRAGDQSEPSSFCTGNGASTFWRVEIPYASQQDVVDMSGNAANAEAEAEAEAAAVAPPRRLTVRGPDLIDSATGAPVRLRGVNVYLDYLRFDDVALLRQLLPAANLVRLVGVFWHDVAPGIPGGGADDIGDGGGGPEDEYDGGDASSDTSLGGDASPVAGASPGEDLSAALCAPADACCVEDASVGFFAPKCLADLRKALTRLTDAGLWVIVAAKVRGGD